VVPGSALWAKAAVAAITTKTRVAVRNIISVSFAESIYSEFVFAKTWRACHLASAITTDARIWILKCDHADLLSNLFPSEGQFLLFAIAVDKADVANETR
jgi:hypothetical protein